MLGAVVNRPATLPEIKEGNHCSCAKYKAEIHVWNLMNGPRRTAVFRKEFLAYSLFGYKRSPSVPCLTWSVGPLP